MLSQGFLGLRARNLTFICDLESAEKLDVWRECVSIGKNGFVPTLDPEDALPWKVNTAQNKQHCALIIFTSGIFLSCVLVLVVNYCCCLLISCVGVYSVANLQLNPVFVGVS